jgi:hypothetical protein
MSPWGCVSYAMIRRSSWPMVASGPSVAADPQ